MGTWGTAIVTPPISPFLACFNSIGRDLSDCLEQVLHAEPCQADWALLPGILSCKPRSSLTTLLSTQPSITLKSRMRTLA